LLGVAALRGGFIGLIREAFSLGSLVAACIAVRAFAQPVAAWLETTAPIGLSPGASLVAAGISLALGTLVIAGVAGRLLRRGAQAVGLGLLDRLGGSLLGATEGALVLIVLFVIGGAILGPEHPELRASRLYGWFETARGGTTGG
jgi:uncharacterized membrane protein required for colicin V production